MMTRIVTDWTRTARHPRFERPYTELIYQPMLEVMALLSKPDQIKVELPIRYHGFEVPNVFVVGYGLDYAERYRDLPYIATLKPEVYA